MKRRLIVLALSVAALLALFCCARAEYDPLKVTMELQTNRFTEPRRITVGITVINTGESDMPGPVTLWYPNGKQVTEFGEPVLAAGSKQSWSGTWDVTQAQLEAGKLRFSIRYTVINDEDKPVSKEKLFSKALIYEGAKASVEVNRTITPTVAGKGQEVSVTYEVVNTGNVDITNVKITENKSISTSAATIPLVKAGEKQSHTFTVKMGTKNLTSSGTVIYTAEGKKNTVTKEAATIRYGEVKLSASLTADKKGGMVGDPVVLTLTLKNTGTDDFEDVTVSDPALGEIFTGEAVPAGETVTLRKELVIGSEDASYQFTVAGKSTSGLDVETATDRLTVKAVDPSEVVDLTVTAEADRDTIYEKPGTVRFTVHVTNNSGADLENVTVTASGVRLYTFPKVLAGETREFTREIDVSMAGTYQFVAQTQNKLGETQRFESNTVYIRYASPTAVPTEAPLVTPPAPHYEKEPTMADVEQQMGISLTETADTLRKVAMGLAVPAAIGLLLVLIGIIGRSKRAVDSMGAVDRLERTSARDYEAPGNGKDEPAAKKPAGEDKPAGEEKPAAKGDAPAEDLPRRRRRSEEGGGDSGKA